MHYILESIFMLFNSKNGANFIVGMIGPPHERITFRVRNNGKTSTDYYTMSRSVLRSCLVRENFWVSYGIVALLLLFGN